MKLEPPPPTAVVIFGASGDLTGRKLLPALFHLHHEGLLPADYRVVGYARTEMTDEQFRARARQAVGEFGRCAAEPEPWADFAARLSYVAGDFASEGDFGPLRAHLETTPDLRPLFYCATPPDAYAGIVRRLGEEGLQRDARIVIEKPFGEDLASAQQLNRDVHEVFEEAQVLRIDHYLGKETVQNILVLRFANAFLEPIWNRRYVDHVQLTVAEEIGIEGRGRFYERTGALRDMVQTHLFQVLTFLAMEPPPSFEPERLRDEKVKVLRAMRTIDPAAVVRGQYEGYHQEDHVAKDSGVETFLAMRVEVDNWRWAGVPFFLRTGKRLARKQAEATIVFKDVPHQLFEREGVGGMVEPNRLSLRLQPNENVALSFTVQRPGVGIDLEAASLEFDYRTAFETPLVEAYELLLLEAMRGDHTLFTRQDTVERAWELLTPLMESPPLCRPYAPGSWGPAEADALIAPRRWHLTD